MSGKVSVIVLNRNGGKYVISCLRSILRQSYRNYEVIVVDNASTDGSVELIKEKFPTVKLILNSRNLGYAEGNNIGIRSSNSEYVAILNYDAKVDDKWLEELIRPLILNKEIALSTPKILLYDGSKINTCGNVIHFTGFSFCRGLGEGVDEYNKPLLISGISGCSFAAGRALLKRIEYLDPLFFAYLEDADLSWRSLMAGYKIAYVPTSIVYHRYAASMTPLKYFLLERNRHILLLKHFKWSTLITLLPALALAEVLAWGYAIKNFYITEKVKAYSYVLRHWQRILKKRVAVQYLRKISDRELLSKMAYEVSLNGLIGLKRSRFLASVVKVFNSLFKVCYNIAKRVTK